MHGFIVREKGGPSKAQIKKRKSMEVVRHNNSEFGKASTYNSLLRTAFRRALLHCREYSMSRRLQSLITSLIKMDADSARGRWDIVKAHLIQLQGFELNAHCSYRKFFKKDVAIEVKGKRVMAKGQCNLSKAVTRKAGFYQVIGVLASIDFKTKRMVSDVKESEVLPCGGSKRFLFEHSLDEADCLFYGMVVCFYIKKGEKFEPVTDEDMKAGFMSYIE